MCAIVTLLLKATYLLTYLLYSFTADVNSLQASMKLRFDVKQVRKAVAVMDNPQGAYIRVFGDGGI